MPDKFGNLKFIGYSCLGRVKKDVNGEGRSQIDKC